MGWFTRQATRFRAWRAAAPAGALLSPSRRVVAAMTAAVPPQHASGRHVPGQDTVPLHELLARLGSPRVGQPRAAERTQQIEPVDLYRVQLFGDPGAVAS